MKFNSEYLQLKRLNLDDWESIPEKTLCLINLSQEVNLMSLQIGITYDYGVSHPSYPKDRVILTDSKMYEKKQIKEIWQIISLE